MDGQATKADGPSRAVGCRGSQAPEHPPPVIGMNLSRQFGYRKALVDKLGLAEAGMRYPVVTRVPDPNADPRHAAKKAQRLGRQRRSLNGVRTA